MHKQLIFILLCSVLTLKSQSQTVTDYDNNIYNTVVIGGQNWMQENLKTTHYNNGNPIMHEPNNTIWWQLTSGAYCNFDNDSSLVSIYGRLYNGFVISDTRNVCPVGWHVPSEPEWRQLFTFLGGDSLAGGQMKDTGTSYWTSPNTGANNLSSFTALPNGARSNSSPTGSSGLGTLATFWGKNAYAIFLSFNHDSIEHGGGNPNHGVGIRCLEDTPNSINEYSPLPSLKVFPNPATDQLQIEIQEQKIAFINIFDIQGVNVSREEINANSIMISVSHLAKGTYLLEVELINGKKTIRKIVITE